MKSQLSGPESGRLAGNITAVLSHPFVFGLVPSKFGASRNS